MCASETPDNRIGERVGWHGPGGTVLLETRNEHSPAGAVAPTGSRKGPAGQGLTDFGDVAKRSVAFRNFPFRSVSFRSFPAGGMASPKGLSAVALAKAGGHV